MFFSFRQGEAGRREEGGGSLRWLGKEYKVDPRLT
jgi:hypothetical protein